MPGVAVGGGAGAGGGGGGSDRVTAWGGRRGLGQRVRGGRRHPDPAVPDAHVVVQGVSRLVHVAAHGAGEGVLQRGVLVLHVDL